MPQTLPILADERIVDVMVQLARATQSHRMIVAGSNAAAVYLELHRRGYPRVTTTKTCRVPSGQYDAALVAWGEHSIEGLKTTLGWFVHFLNAAGVLVVWFRSDGQTSSQALRLALAGLGFRIETGASCENGVAISARRIESSQIAKVA